MEISLATTTTPDIFKKSYTDTYYNHPIQIIFEASRSLCSNVSLPRQHLSLIKISDELSIHTFQDAAVG